MDRAADLRADYDRLGMLLHKTTDVVAATAAARERRMIGELLEALETPEEVSPVDEVAERRRAKSGDSGSSSRRRKSG